MIDFQEIYILIQDKISGWLTDLLLLLPNLLLAIIIFTLFYLIGKLIKNITPDLIRKISKNRALGRFLATVFFITTIGIGFFIALGILQLDKTLSSLLAGVGIGGIALSFAFKDILSNFVSGIIIILHHPFKIGDLIEIKEYLGTIYRITVRTTLLKTPDGQIITLPNQDILQNPIRNYTTEGTRRVDITLGISYGDDLEKAKKTGIEAIKKLKFVDKEKEIEFYYTELAGSSVNVTIMFWIEFGNSPADWYKAQSTAIEAVKRTYDKNKILMPFPTTTLDFGPKGGRYLSEELKKK